MVEKDFPCRFGCDEDVCNHSVYKECMEKIEAADVLEAVRYIVRESHKRTKHEIV